jgi:osmotically-inducible protein OsmY
MLIRIRESDIQLREDVLRELRWSMPVIGREIGVAVRDGIVTLGGAVGSYAEKLSAQEAAYRVEGVLSVANEIEINRQGSRVRNDVEIAQAVRHALEWDAHVPHERIQSAVSNGWIALEGRVELLREREDAERIVRRLAGVRGVYNEITVNPPEARTENVRNAIEDALRRRAEMEANGVGVSLRDGVVNLSGRVHTWKDKQAILSAISHAPGVRGVNDQLTIDPYF